MLDIVRRAKDRAAKTGLPFDLDEHLDELEVRWRAGRCEATGIPFAPGDGTVRGPWSASLDRVDPAIGYVFTNVRWVVWIFNAAKGPGSDADVLTLARAVVARADLLRSVTGGE